MSSRGFTLLELLVVMVIIGVLATMVSLAVGGRAVDDRLQAESRRLEELFRLASDEAQAKGLEFGFRQTEDGFEFLVPDGQTGVWEVVSDGLFRPRQIPAPFVLQLRVDGRLLKPVKSEPAQTQAKEGVDALDPVKRADDSQRIEPQILILSTGEMTPFTLDLRLPDAPDSYRVEGNALGELALARVEDKS